MAHEQTATLAQPAGVQTDEVIAVDGLTFTYPEGGRAAVRGIDLAVRDGGTFDFLGPSGTGKINDAEDPHGPADRFRRLGRDLG